MKPLPEERVRAVFDGVARHPVEDQRHPLYAIEIRVEDRVRSGGVLPSYRMEN